MKKTAIILAVAFVVLAGYIVGQFTLSSSSQGRVSSSGSVTESYDETRPTQEDPPQAQLRAIDSAKNIAALEFFGQVEDYPGLIMPEPQPGVVDPDSEFLTKSGTMKIRVNDETIIISVEKLTDLLPKDSYIEFSELLEFSANLTVRIPAAELDKTIKEIRKLGVVEVERIETQDNTFESIDNASRKEVIEARKLSLLEELKNANNQQDRDRINLQIESANVEIANLNRQSKILENKINFSTMNVQLVQEGEDKRNESQTMLARAWEKSASGLLTSTGGILIFVSAIFPFLLLSIAGWAVFQNVKSRKQNAHVEETQEEIPEGNNDEA